MRSALDYIQGYGEDGQLRVNSLVQEFLLDDKGCTLLAVFGLPPRAHEDDTGSRAHSHEEVK